MKGLGPGTISPSAPPPAMDASSIAKGSYFPDARDTKHELAQALVGTRASDGSIP
jgi:hypothetical protein